MGVLRSSPRHINALVAVGLALAFLVEIDRRGPALGEPVISGLAAEPSVAIALGVVFLLSLATRRQVPLLPLALGFVALGALGRGAFDAFAVLVVGLALAAYSVGARACGRSGQVGALAVGALVGLSVARAGTVPLEPRAIAGPVFVLLGAWLAGLAVRSIRAARGDERVNGALDWERAGSSQAPDSAGRDDTVRELRDVIERTMSTVILQARGARRSLDSDPATAHRALVVVDAAATDALEETQRLTGQLLSPHGTPLLEPQPGLGDVDYLAERMSDAGLPVDTRVEGRPLPLTPELDAVAFRVVHEALMATLADSRDAASSVVIRYLPDELRIEIVDDGVAAADDAATETARLEAVRSEVAALGGTLDAGPGEDRGYWVVARLPYEPDWD